MSVYTKTGDKGETSLFNGKRVSKSDSRISAIGAIDEANTFLGLATSFIKNKKLKSKITEIQRHLFEIGAILAGAKLNLNEKLISQMEKEIDEMDKELSTLTHFILPGGGKAGSLLFMARTFVRRAERKVVALSCLPAGRAKKEKVPQVVLAYLNRLSDYLYVLARYINFREGVEEILWLNK